MSFDRIAKDYTTIHNKNLEWTGQTSEYFVQHKAAAVARFVQERKLSNSLSLLDFGCGVGRFKPAIEAKISGIRYQGVDVSEKSVLEAQRALGEMAFAVFDGRKIPHANESFDLVFAACVFHHIAPDERDALLKEIFRVLKTGGHLIVFEHNPFNPLTQYIVKTCEFDDDAILLTKRETARRARSAGFQIADSKYVLFAPESIQKKIPSLEKVLGWVPFGGQYWLAARK